MSGEFYKSHSFYEEDGFVTGYMCKIDWECELGGAAAS